MGLTDASFQFHIKSTTLTSHFYKLVLLIIIVITLTQILLNMLDSVEHIRIART